MSSFQHLLHDRSFLNTGLAAGEVDDLGVVVDKLGNEQQRHFPHSHNAPPTPNSKSTRVLKSAHTSLNPTH